MNTHAQSSDPGGKESARHHIQNLIAEYGHAIDTRNPGRFAAVWHSDARWSIDGSEMAGIDAILQGAQGFWATYSQMWHCFAVPTVEVRGSTASGECIATAILVTADGSAEQAIARYLDQYTYIDGSWRISDRTTVIERRVSLP